MACKALADCNMEHEGFHYDEADCDLSCLAEDIIIEFNLPSFGDEEFDKDIEGWKDG
jgi:hypothetical protein